MKLKTCKNCKEKYAARVGQKSFENWCSPSCGFTLSVQAKVKLQKKKDSVRKIELRPLSFYKKKAQTVFNQFIVLRDKGLKCISCNAIDNVRWSCGHYKTSGGNAHLTFNEDNCHKQCWFSCNSNKSGNVINMRLGMIERIGIERVEALETSLDLHKKSYTKEELLEIEKTYKQKVKLLKGDL